MGDLLSGPLAGGMLPHKSRQFPWGINSTGSQQLPVLTCGGTLLPILPWLCRLRGSELLQLFLSHLAVPGRSKEQPAVRLIQRTIRSRGQRIQAGCGHKDSSHQAVGTGLLLRSLKADAHHSLKLGHAAEHKSLCPAMGSLHPAEKIHHLCQISYEKHRIIVHSYCQRCAVHQFQLSHFLAGLLLLMGRCLCDKRRQTFPYSLQQCCGLPNRGVKIQLYLCHGSKPPV